MSGFHTHLAALTSLIDDIGEPCLASGVTAAALHGIDGFRLMPPFDVMVPRGRNIARAAHREHASAEMKLIDRSRVLGVPVLSPTRTVIDLARMLGRERLTVAVDCVLRDGGSSEDYLFRRIGALRGKGRHGSRTCWRCSKATRSSAAATAGWSVRCCTSSLLPALADRQRRPCGRDGATSSSVSTSIGRALRSSSRRWGTAGTARERRMQIDAERMNRLQLDGFVVLQCTYADVVDGARQAVADVREALRPYRLAA